MRLNSADLTYCSCSTETDRFTVPSEDVWVWLSGVFGGKSVSLECITGQSERSRADFGDLLLRVILDVSHVQRIGDFYGNALYKCSFYLLTFTYIAVLRLTVSVLVLYPEEPA